MPRQVFVTAFLATLLFTVLGCDREPVFSRTEPYGIMFNYERARCGVPLISRSLTPDRSGTFLAWVFRDVVGHDAASPDVSLTRYAARSIPARGPYRSLKTVVTSRGVIISETDVYTLAGGDLELTYRWDEARAGRNPWRALAWRGDLPVPLSRAEALAQLDAAGVASGIIATVP